MLRVLTLNVLFGGEERFDAILRLLAGERPDLVVLQECLGWEEGDRLARAAAAIGVPADGAHALLGRARPRGSGKRYHVALLSRRPLRDAVVHADPAVLGHCVAQATLDGTDGPLTVLGAHFDSHGEDPRLREARFVNSLVSPDAFAAGFHLLAGDFNALSPQDPYPPDLADLVRRAGTDKYGHPPRFDAMRVLLAHGWVDALRACAPDGPWVTAPRDRGGVRIDYRTDYVLCSPPLAHRLRAARVVDATGASDHHALAVDLEA